MAWAADLESHRLRNVAQAGRNDPWPGRLVASAAITRAARIMRMRMEEVLERLDLSLQRFELLGLLRHSETGQLPLSELRKATMVHAATMTYTIDQLEKQGMLRRKPHPDDRRGVIIELTARARLVVDAAERELVAIGWGLEDLSDDEAAEVAVLLSRLTEVAAKVSTPKVRAGG